MSWLSRVRRWQRIRLSLAWILVFSSLFASLVLLWCWASCELPSPESGLKHSKACAGNHPKSENDVGVMKSTLTVIIITKPDSVSRRATIRNTWLRLRNDEVSYRFVVGTRDLDSTLLAALRKEQVLHADLLLLEDLVDNYHTLTQKVLQSIVWVHQNAPSRFLLKVDDDSFVILRLHNAILSLKSLQLNLENWEESIFSFAIDVMPFVLLGSDYPPHKRSLLKALAKIEKQKSRDRCAMLYYGRASPKIGGKWKEENWNLCDRYLPYALGGGYVLGDRLVRFLAETSAIFRTFNSEDVSVGTWLAGLNVYYLHDQRFDTEHISRGCFNSLLVTHKKTEAEMSELYQHLVGAGKICAKEERTRLSYAYNWRVPPSQCCTRNDSSIPF